MADLKGTSQSLIVSLIVHGIVVLVVGAYLVTQTEPFHDLIDASILKPPDPPKPKVRKSVVKPVIKPAVPTQSVVLVQQAQPTPRVTTAVNLRSPQVPAENAVAFSNRPLKLQSPQQPHLPQVINPNQPILQVVTSVDLPVSDSAGALAYSAPVPGGGGSLNRFSQRGISGVKQGVQWGQRDSSGGIQSLIGATDAAPSGLDALNAEMRLGNQLMIPLGPNELGARIYTDLDTGLPTGFFQICYVRFRQRKMNEFFRVDPTALYFLVKWMTENTRIKGRMSGRTLFLDDPGILDSPMVYMNGTRVARLRPIERANLTRYLVERGGFIFVDDDRLSGPQSSKVFAQSLRAEFREIILEAGGRELYKIPNDHPIWNAPFHLGGQPEQPNLTSSLVGRTYPMTAFELNGKLAVVISYNDYNNGWEAPGGASMFGPPTFAPEVLRMGVNFMFYAATHGKISDYEHYVPPKQWKDEDILERLPKRAPQGAYVPAIDDNPSGSK